MFFDEKLVKCKTLGKVWRAAHNQNNPDEVGDVSLQKICETLEEWVENDDINPLKRISLRTSAVLISGVAMNYKQELELLVRDVVQMDAKIVMHRRKEIAGETSTDSSESGQISTPEQMMRQIELPADINISNAALREANVGSKSPVQAPQISHSFSQCTENSHISQKSSTEKGSKRPESTGNSENKSEDTQSSNTENRCDVQTSRTNKNDDRATGASLKELTEPSTSTPQNQMNKSASCDASEDQRLIRSASPIIPYSRPKRQVTATWQDAPSRSSHWPSKRRKTGSSYETEFEKLISGPELNKSFVETNRSTASDGNVRNTTPSGENTVLGCSVPVRKDPNGSNRKKKSTRRTQRREQETQTSDEGIDKTLPFGYLLIHDTYNARIPCKIVLSSLNPNVRNLMKDPHF